LGISILPLSKAPLTGYFSASKMLDFRISDTRAQMTDHESGGPSLIKLGKLANGKDFDKLESLWVPALESGQYTWRELIPIAGQVGRQGAPERSDTLMEILVDWVENKEGPAAALEVAREAGIQLPTGKALRLILHRLYKQNHPDFEELPLLLEKLMPAGCLLNEAVPQMDLYVQLPAGAFALDLEYLVPGLVEWVDAEKGLIGVLFEDRRHEYGPATAKKLLPRPADFFPALVLYNPDRLREVADSDPVEFVKMALRSQRENRLAYKDLKGSVVDLLGEKGWKTWWQNAKRELKREPIIGMSAGSQPSFRILRQADRYEDRVRREFDFQKNPLDKLLKVLAYLDEVGREEKQTPGQEVADPELLAHLGNGAAKVAVSVLKESPSLALAGLALHAEIAARGVAVAKPNPKAGAAVVARIADAGELVGALPEALLQRIMAYIRTTMPDRWGEVWALVLMRAGKRLCDTITRGLIEGNQKEALESALLQAVAKPTSSPDLLGWLWRTRHASSAASQFLVSLESLPVDTIGDAMFSLLDSQGKLYGMSMDEDHLKSLESGRLALATQSSRPLLGLIDSADRNRAMVLKRIIESNHGLAPSMRTQLLGYLRSKFADIFIEITREWEDATTVYTTETGLRQVQDALEHIKDVEIPEVAAQIGEAASHGDLSENAEYTAALEKRDQLFSRANSIEADLNRAVIITPDMAASDFVNAGTRVTAQAEESGQEEIYTFLGPWDTDVEQKILNYQAPLSMAFMGAKVGDRVVFGEEGEQRAWTVIKIEPAL
jgi:transcription elongation GreA/GreB family factor